MVLHFRATHCLVATPPPPPRTPLFLSLSSVLVNHPSLTKPRRSRYTPRAQLFSGLIKRSRQILATVNKSSGQRAFLYSTTRVHLLCSLVRLLEVCGKQEHREVRPTGRSGGLTGHLLDPAEGAQVTGGGRLLKQLHRDRKRKEGRGVWREQHELGVSWKFSRCLHIAAFCIGARWVNELLIQFDLSSKRAPFVFLHDSPRQLVHESANLAH